jgi:hypothetical protein
MPDAIERRRHNLPLAWLERRLQVLFGRQAITVDAFAIAAPNHTVDQLRLAPDDRHAPFILELGPLLTRPSFKWTILWIAESAHSDEADDSRSTDERTMFTGN